MLELVNHFSGYQDRPVLQNVSVRIEPGDVVAIVGESGAGKSTLLTQLYRVAPATIAWCPQTLGLVPGLSVFHNIYMGMLAERSVGVHLLNLVWPQKQAWRRVLQAAEQVGVSELLRQSVGTLSGGQQQRVALARALLQGRVSSAKLPAKSRVTGSLVRTFIGDEPVSSVDQKHGAELLEIIKKQFETVVVATHDRQLALHHFDRVIGIQQGQVVFDARTTELSLDDLAAVCRAES